MTVVGGIVRVPDLVGCFGRFERLLGHPMPVAELLAEIRRADLPIIYVRSNDGERMEATDQVDMVQVTESMSALYSGSTKAADLLRKRLHIAMREIRSIKCGRSVQEVVCNLVKALIGVCVWNIAPG